MLNVKASVDFLLKTSLVFQLESGSNNLFHLLYDQHLQDE
jgi:hypothetical protein